MENESPQKQPVDENVKCYGGIEFPSGDIDDLIFGLLELTDSER